MLLLFSPLSPAQYACLRACHVPRVPAPCPPPSCTACIFSGTADSFSPGSPPPPSTSAPLSLLARTSLDTPVPSCSSSNVLPSRPPFGGILEDISKEFHEVISIESRHYFRWLKELPAGQLQMRAELQEGFRAHHKAGS